MTNLILEKNRNYINEYTGKLIQTTHYIVETNRLSFMLDASLNFILRQLTTYFFRKNGNCWIERKQSAVVLHFLIDEDDEVNSILWTDAFHFKSYVENILGETCTLWNGGVCYV